MISEKLGERAELLEGYREYRRATYVLLYRAVAKEGLLDYLKQPRTLREITNQFGYLPERIGTLRAVVNVLTTLGAVEARPGDDNEDRYVSVRDEPEHVTRPLDVQLLQNAIGQERAETVVYAQQVPEALGYLRGAREGNEFGSGQLARWQSLLEFPYWEFGRRACAEAIATPGGSVVDLACGLGHGVRELSALVGPDGTVLGAELSPDFVALASRDLPANCSIRQADLNNGVAFLEDDSLTGAMMMGAFHFIRDKAGFLADVRRALKPGGKVALGNVVRQTNTFDQAAHDITCSMLTPPVVMATPEQIEKDIADSGLELVDSFEGFGCVGWYEMVRR
ncbi:MAG TPA: methyltransferase domain-containing protein [Micromonosporaceae bacterium]